MVIYLSNFLATIQNSWIPICVYNFHIDTGNFKAHIKTRPFISGRMIDKLATEFPGLIIYFEKQSSTPELSRSSHTAITFLKLSGL